MTTTTFDTRKLTSLKNHPLNAQVFGELDKDEDCDQFTESVKELGVLQPLVIVDDGTIISGHRRRQAASRAGLKEVPVIVRRDLKTTEQVFEAWFDANRQREMTVEQKARWYEKRKAAHAAEAAKREKAGTLVANSHRVGRSTELAAAEVSLSPKTAEKAVEVVHAIDAAKASGDTAKAKELSDTLNNGTVAAAHRKATEKPAEDSPAIVKDSLDRDIPAHLKGQHKLAAKIQAVANTLDKVKKELTPLAEEPGGAFIQLQAILIALKDVKGLISQSRYWTDCPRCKGKKNPKCDRCDGHGFIPHSRKGQLSAEDKAYLGIEK